MKIVFIALFALLFVACCSANKVVSASSERQQVIDAWDNNCVNCSFGNYVGSATVRDSHTGQAGTLQLDLDALMQAMRAELDSTAPADPEIDDTLNEVVDDPNWYR